MTDTAKFKGAILEENQVEEAVSDMLSSPSQSIERGNTTVNVNDLSLAEQIFSTPQKTQYEIDEQYIQTLDVGLFSYHQTLQNEVLLNLGLGHGGKPLHDPTWATNRYIQITRIQKVLSEFEILTAQNKITEKRTIL